MKINLGLLITLVLILASVFGYAQSDTPTDNFEEVVLPPSPDVYAFTKYDQIKIDEYTGMVSESIPLFSITEGSLEVPVSLNYRSGGFQVKERSSWVGLGWSLNAGGVVSRTVVGAIDNDRPDNLGNGFLSLGEITSYEALYTGGDDQLRYSRLHEMANGCYDGQPDIFSFNVNGLTGKFNFNWDGELEISSTQKVDITIKWENGYNSTIIGWTIKGPDGKVYEFDQWEETRIMTSSASNCFISSMQVYNSAWMLTEIKTPGLNRSIHLEYEPYVITDFETGRSVTRIHNTSYDSYCPGTVAGENKYSSHILNYYGKKLSRIYGSHTPLEIIFENGVARTDISGTDLYALGAVKLLNDGVEMKKFDLAHDFSTNRLTLKSVQEKSSTDISNATKFEYYGMLPSVTKNSHDIWGFPNDYTGSDRFPLYEVQFFSDFRFFGSAERSPSLNGSKSGMLKKITFPTGGFNEYFYELNDFAFVNGAQINDYETVLTGAYAGAVGNYSQCSPFSGATTESQTSTFEVTNQQTLVSLTGQAQAFTEDYFSAGRAPKANLKDSQGNILVAFSLANSGQRQSIRLDPGTYTLYAEATWKDCSGNPRDRASISVSYKKVGSQLLLKKPTGGVRVSKIEKNDEEGNLASSLNYSYEMEDGYSSGFIYDEPRLVYYTTRYVRQEGQSRYVSRSCPCAIVLTANRHNTELTQGSHIGYKRVKITQGDGENGYKILSFKTANDAIYLTPPFQPASSLSFRSGLLDKEEYFERGSASPSKIVDYGYSSHMKTTMGLKVDYLGHAGPFAERNFDLGPYSVNAGHVQKTYIKESDILPNGTLEKVSRYTFDGELQFMENKETSDHKQKNITKYFYPKDFTGSNHIQYLEDSHILNKPIEVVEIVEASGVKEVIDASYFEYSTYFLDKVYKSKLDKPVPFNLFELSKDNSGNRDASYLTTPEVDLEYDSNTELIKSQQSKGIRKSYLRNDDGILIAEVTNASVDQIFHSSFEYSQGTAGNAKTGSEYYNSGNWNFQSIAGFTPPAGVEMVMSYWFWQNNKWNYSGEIPFTNSFSAGSRLDEIRAYPMKAQMATYILHPSFGIESVTDPAGRTTTYKYDGLGRLESVYDHEGNILQMNEYNYGSN